jgi:LemA protein
MATNASKRTGLILVILLLIVVAFFAVNYNSLVKKEEQVKLTWSDLQSAYQRRGDLVPNLVSVVKAGTDYEKQTLQQLAEARAKAAQVTVGSAEPTPGNYTNQEKAQAEVANSVNRIIAVVENYPDLKGTKSFLYLQSQLEGTERRIKVARNDFNASVADYNQKVRSFPSSIVAKLTGYHVKEGFSAEAGADQSPEIKF